MKTKNDIDNAIELAKNWLLNSGIQNVGTDEETNGGFKSWYDFDRKKHRYLFPEVTGYAITTLLFLNKVKQDKLLIERAELAAQWVMKQFHESGGIKTKIYYENPWNADPFLRTTNFFDNGIVLIGLVNLYEQTKKKEYLEAARKIANFLVKMQKKDGSFYAVYDTKSRKFTDSDEKWSTHTGSFHTKPAVGLVKLHLVDKNQTYYNSARKVCEWSLKLQKDGGRFVTHKKNHTHAHPHCYSAEGLLLAGHYLNEKKFLRSAADATKWLLDNQLPSGGIPSMFTNDKFIVHERVDILAQTLRLGTILLSLGLLDKKYEEKISKLVDRLLEFQYMGEDIKQKGGFLYGVREDGIKFNQVNCWSTVFAVQALAMYKQFLKSRSKIDFELLT